MILLNLILPLFFSFVIADTGQLHLQQDLQKDLAKLQQNSRYFISDNSSLSPSLQGIANDLQLFALVSDLDLEKATHSQQQQGPHQVQQWTFSEGDIRQITQIQSEIQLDTVVTQRYLENRAPTQQRVMNDFTFRTYLVSTSREPAKLYYLTEATQGLLAYRLGERQVEINYADKKQGLVDVLPKYEAEIQALIQGLSQ